MSDEADDKRKPKLYSPLPWRFEHDGTDKFGGKWGKIFDANGKSVAESIYKRDAEAIIAALSSTPLPEGMVPVPLSKLEDWRVSLSQGDQSCRWEIEKLLAAAKAPK